MTDWGDSWAKSSITVTLAVVCGLAVLVAARAPAVQASFGRRAAHYEDAARLLMWRYTGADLLWMQLGFCAASTLLLALSGSAVAWLAVALTLLGPQVWLNRCRKRRREHIEVQLEAWLLMLSNALRATPAPPEALQASAALVPQPLRSELELLLKEHRLGMPLDRALEQMGQRVGSKLLSTALSLIVISRTSGGDLSRALETSAASLREMVRLEGVLRTKTAEGRAQAVLISMIPFALVLVVGWLDPQFFAPLVDTYVGRLVVCAAAALWLVAVALAHRIVQQEP